MAWGTKVLAGSFFAVTTPNEENLSGMHAEKIRAAVSDAIPQVQAENAEKLAEYKRLHESDVKSYHFRCERYGEFLALYIRRGPDDNKTVHAINIAQTTVKLVEGHLPDLGGEVGFRTRGRTSLSDSSASISIVAIWPGIEFEHSYPRRRVIETMAKPDEDWVCFGDDDYILADLRVPECAQPALDDEIHIELLPQPGTGIILTTPAGCGKDVFDTIMAAVGQGE